MGFENLIPRLLHPTSLYLRHPSSRRHSALFCRGLRHSYRKFVSTQMKHIIAILSLLLIAATTVWAGESGHAHGAAESACSHLQLLRKGQFLQLVDGRSGTVVDKFENVKTTVKLADAGHGPWRGRDDDGVARTVDQVDCAVIVTFEEESALLVWHDEKGRWHRLWLAD